MPVTEREKTVRPKYLSADLLQYPDAALAVVHKEVLHMGEYARKMLHGVLAVLETRNLGAIEEIVREDENIDILYKELRPYLSKISQQELGIEETFKETGSIIVAEELENFGDVISKSLSSPLRKYAERNYHFGKADGDHIVYVHRQATEALEKTLCVYETSDLVQARMLLEDKAQFAILYKAMHITHLQKHRSGVTETIQTSTVYINMLADFRQLISLTGHIAQAVIDRKEALR